MGSIKWNEVTWYSRLIAIVFFLGVVPAIAFDIGSQIGQMSSEAASPVYIETSHTVSGYKQAFRGGLIPASWSEYGNGFSSSVTPINDEKGIVGAGNQAYAQRVIDSISPYQIVFSDVPYSRVDIFQITPQLREKLIQKARDSHSYTTQDFGQNSFDVISFPDKGEGTPDAMYIHQFSGTNTESADILLYIVYPSDYASFRKSVARYFSTLGGSSN